MDVEVEDPTKAAEIHRTLLQLVHSNRFSSRPTGLSSPVTTVHRSARALIRATSLLVLDEATSALTPHTKSAPSRRCVGWDGAAGRRDLVWRADGDETGQHRPRVGGSASAGPACLEVTWRARAPSSAVPQPSPAPLGMPDDLEAGVAGNSVSGPETRHAPASRLMLPVLVPAAHRRALLPLKPRAGRPGVTKGPRRSAAPRAPSSRRAHHPGCGGRGWRVDRGCAPPRSCRRR